MKISLIQVGKTQESYLREGIDEYHKRLNKYLTFNEITIPDLKNRKNLSTQEIKSREGDLIMKYCRNDEFLILLDERGRNMSSMEFSEYLSKKINIGRDIVMIIGGAYGFSRDLYERADDMISLSRMTFSHQLVRLILAEQLYRALTIIRGEPYHHE